MSKTKTNIPPTWVQNLRALMGSRGLNPRSLSLKAGLNPTAVRDMIEGRSRFPRYDTAQALATALDTTPAQLMGGGVSGEASKAGAGFSEDLELLTEIIARLQEVTEELDRKVTPRDFAAMTATIYRRMQESEQGKPKVSSIRPQIIDLLDFETLRQRKSRR